ncbi:hypothetical protein D3C72_1970720 [compost metagenome]
MTGTVMPSVGTASTRNSMAFLWFSNIRVSSSRGSACSPSSKSSLVSSKLLLLPSRRDDDQDKSISNCSSTSRAYVPAGC